MNRRMVFYVLGNLVKLEAALLLLPTLVSLLYGETCVYAFLITIAVALCLGFGLSLLSRPDHKLIFAKEGFVIVALTWLVISAVGALPFVISGEIPSYIDAFFETVSGFTTTGASILSNVEAMSHGTLFWRSFTHWIGGMGILVFIVAVMPSVSDRSIHILRAEMPGPTVGKLVPKARQTALVLYLIYLVMTVAEIILLLCGGVSLFESAVLAFGTAGTGGFAVLNTSIASYSHYVQWVVTVFMLCFGVNFNLYYLLLVRKFRSVVKNEELWSYLGIFLISTALITANILPLYHNVSDAIRLAAFQVSSVTTTTGFSTVNFDLWPELSRGLLVVLMFIGACGGSTAGGLKVTRVVTLFKAAGREIRKLLHPRSVSVIRQDGRQLDEAAAHSVLSYFALYMILFFVMFLLVCLDNFDFVTNFSAVAACYNNIGPGLSLVGAAGNYGGFSVLSKLVLSVGMLLGRLEIYPLLISFSPSTWVKK